MTDVDTLPPHYRPSADEPYMNPHQLTYFRQKLMVWRHSLLDEVNRSLSDLHEQPDAVGDDADRAVRESNANAELRARERSRRLLSEIDAALKRIQDGSYGYCDETGEEIGLARLEASPIATLCIEAQERRERSEGQFVRIL